MTFVERRMRATFSYGTGADGTGAPEVTTVEDLRMQARMSSAGAASLGQCDLDVWGMTLSSMNKLSSLGSPLTTQRRNTLVLEAGDVGKAMSKVFEGSIFSAWADLNSAPNHAFRVNAHAGLVDQVAPAQPYSASGPIDAAKIMEYLAGKMGYAFVNDGVSGVIIKDPAYNGTFRQQAYEVALHGNFDWVIDGSNLVIWPKDGSRNGDVATIGPGNGMVGYPSYVANGMLVRALFDPRFRFGCTVIVDSALPTSAATSVNARGRQFLPVDGKWKIVTLSHSLAAQFPGGDWFTEMMLTLPGLTVLG